MLLLVASLLLISLPSTALAERRDPLRPPDFHAAPSVESDFNADAWRLASTLVSGDRRVAIINGRAVNAGETVGGARVLAIERGRVRLNYRGHRFVLRRATPDIRHHEQPTGASVP